MCGRHAELYGVYIASWVTLGKACACSAEGCLCLLRRQGRKYRRATLFLSPLPLKTGMLQRYGTWDALLTMENDFSKRKLRVLLAS